MNKVSFLGRDYMFMDVSAKMKILVCLELSVVTSQYYCHRQGFHLLYAAKYEGQVRFQT